MLGKELSLDLRSGSLRVARKARQEIDNAFRACWTRQYGVDGHVRALGQGGETARNGELRCFSHAIMDHLAGRDQTGFAGDKDDPAPVALQHAREVLPSQSRAAQDIDFEITPPIIIGYLTERLDLVNAEIIDQHVDFGSCLQQAGCSFCRGCVRNNSSDSSAPGTEDGTDRLIELRLFAAGDDNARALGGKFSADFKTDTGGRTGNEGGLPFQM